MPAASNRRKPAFTRVGKPELFDELRTRADQSFEIGDALGRQTAGEVSLDDLVLDDEFTIHRRRRRAGRSSRSGRSLVHARGYRYDSQLPSWFKIPHIQGRADRRGHRCRTARGAKRPGATQAGICRWSYRIAPAYAAILMSASRCAVSHSANGFPRNPATWFAVCRAAGSRPSAAPQPLVFTSIPPRF